MVHLQNTLVITYCASPHHISTQSGHVGIQYKGFFEIKDHVTYLI